jgi:hypothetical protein
MQGFFVLQHSYIFIKEVFELLFSKESVNHFKDLIFFSSIHESHIT